MLPPWWSATIAAHNLHLKIVGFAFDSTWNCLWSIKIIMAAVFSSTCFFFFSSVLALSLLFWTDSAVLYIKIWVIAKLTQCLSSCFGWASQYWQTQSNNPLLWVLKILQKALYCIIVVSVTVIMFQTDVILLRPDLLFLKRFTEIPYPVKCLIWSSLVSCFLMSILLFSFPD